MPILADLEKGIENFLPLGSSQIVLIAARPGAPGDNQACTNATANQ
jgi:hypothetical protein